MGGNLFLILIVVSAIWQVIGSIAEKKAKQKQQEELARRRAEAQQRGGSPATPTPNVLVQSPGGATAPTSARSRAEEIAARRKAQIDELRRRAAERSSGGGGGRIPNATPSPVGRSAPAASSTRSGRATSASAGRTSAPVNPTRRPEIARDFEELTRRRESERAAKAIDVQRNDEREAMERRRREVEAKARQAKAAREEAAREREAARPRMASGTGSLLGSMVSGSTSDRLRALAGNKQAMRDAILLREILDAPAAFRSSPIPIDGATGLGN